MIEVPDIDWRAAGSMTIHAVRAPAAFRKTDFPFLGEVTG
jgi:hypothetical protein